MALFCIQRPFLPTGWQYIWKRKANAYHTPLSKKYRHYFWQVQDPGMHYIAYFGSVNQTYLPQDSVQNIIDIFLHSVHYTRLKLCSLHFPQPCTHSHPLLYIQVHLIRLHLNTSWKTRHLVISHITSEKSYLFPMRTQKMYIWYNLQKLIMKTGL